MPVGPAVSVPAKRPSTVRPHRYSQRHQTQRPDQPHEARRFAMSTITIERPSTEAVESTSPPAGAFTARRADLVEALTTTGLAVAKRGSLPIMGQVLLTCRNGDLTMTTFDGEFAVIVRLPGAATADGQLLLEHAGLTKTLAAIAKGERKADADAMTVTVINTTSGPVLAAGGYEIP